MIKELVIISGKGGTGKTSVTASFAALAENAVIADCDVDAADLKLVLGGTTVERERFVGGKKAFIDPARCDRCGTCAPLCRFDAISASCAIDPLACEGCGVCAHFCPCGAIEMREHVSGERMRTETPHGALAHAKLGIAEGNSGKLVTLLRKKAREYAEGAGANLIIADGSPGTGCPVIATITGASYVLIVTEPTVSGMHDLTRVNELARHFRVPSAVCVNKADINEETTREIRDYCAAAGIPMLTPIPYDPDVTKAQIAGLSVVECSAGPAATAIRRLWEEVSRAIE